MSYTIKVRVIQTNPQDWYNIVEKTVWHYTYDSTWTECGGEHTLTMGGNGTFGMLCFRNPAGNYFLVVLGVYNYKRWSNIVPNQTLSNMGVEIHPSYYTDDADNRSEMLWKQLAHLDSETATGVIKVDYWQEDGNNLEATIMIMN